MKRNSILDRSSGRRRFFLSRLAPVVLFLAVVPAALAREPGEGIRPRADLSGWRSHPRSEYMNQGDVRRGRWRSQLRPHLAARRMTSQNLAEELKKMMTPGLRTQRLSDERRSSLQEKVRRLPITSRNKGEFVLPEPDRVTSTQPTAPTSIDEAEKARSGKHSRRFDSMSDSQKSRMRDQMRRVRPLSFEERADAAQRNP